MMYCLVLFFSTRIYLLPLAYLLVSIRPLAPSLKLQMLNLKSAPSNYSVIDSYLDSTTANFTCQRQCLILHDILSTKTL